MTTNPHPTETIPAHALGALDPEDAACVADHLSGCELCQAELRAYRLVVDSLPLAAVEVLPPQGLKRSIMDQVATPAPVQPVEQPGSWWDRLASPWLAVATGALIFILALGNLSLWQQLRASPAVPDHLRVATLAGTEHSPDAVGLVVFDMEGREGTLVVDDLAVLEPSQQYQLWLLGDGSRDNGGVFSVSQNGYGWLKIVSETPLHSYASFGITVEPAGGSPIPSGPRVMSGKP